MCLCVCILNAVTECSTAFTARPKIKAIKSSVFAPPNSTSLLSPAHLFTYKIGCVYHRPPITLLVTAELCSSPHQQPSPLLHPAGSPAEPQLLHRAHLCSLHHRHHPGQWLSHLVKLSCVCGFVQYRGSRVIQHCLCVCRRWPWSSCTTPRMAATNRMFICCLKRWVRVTL